MGYWLRCPSEFSKTAFPASARVCGQPPLPPGEGGGEGSHDAGGQLGTELTLTLYQGERERTAVLLARL